MLSSKGWIHDDNVNFILDNAVDIDNIGLHQVDIVDVEFLQVLLTNVEGCRINVDPQDRSGSQHNTAYS